MASINEIEGFLRDFKFKLGFWGLLIRSDRDKNFKTMKALEFSINDVKNELAGLEFVNFSDGPIEEKLYGNADMWVFGKFIQEEEVYIKITMGQPGSQVLCISFHFAEQPLNYPYKK
jgi:hypothetical protein